MNNWKLATLVSGAFVLTLSFKGLAQEKKPMLTHIALSVVDLGKSVDFYRNVLYLDTIPEPFRDGKHAWLRIGLNNSLHLIEDAEEISEHRRNTHLCFSVPDMDDFVARLDKYGIAYINVRGEAKKVGIRVDGIKQLYLQDPDGYWIEINDETY